MKRFTIATLLALLVASNIGTALLVAANCEPEVGREAGGNTGTVRDSAVLLLAAAAAGNTGV